MCLCVWYGCCSQKCNGPTLCFPAPVWLMFWLLIPGLVLQFSAFWNVGSLSNHSVFCATVFGFCAPKDLHNKQKHSGLAATFMDSWGLIDQESKSWGVCLVSPYCFPWFQLGLIWEHLVFFKSPVICLALQYKLPVWVLICESHCMLYFCVYESIREMRINVRKGVFYCHTIDQTISVVELWWQTVLNCEWMGVAAFDIRII